MEISQINEWITYAENRNSKRIQEQNKDQTFFDDTYEIPVVEDPNYLIRTGFVASMVNGVTQQAIAYVPKVYTEARNKTSKKGADNVAEVGNRWVKNLSKQSTHPFKETFKKLIGTCGEAWIILAHNDFLTEYDGDWREDYPDTMPVFFLMYDPRIVFHDPAEDLDGKPTRLVIKCKRAIGDIKVNYPKWTNPKQAKDGLIDFEYFMDKDTRYARADGEALFRDAKGNYANGDGRLSNIYHSVPAIHKYSGYGIDTFDKEPSLLAFTRTRMIRDKIIEDSAMATDFRYNQHELAWVVKDIVVPEGIVLPDNFLDNYRRRPNTINKIQGTGGAKIEAEEPSAFSEAAYAYRDRVRADLNSEYPMSLRGMTSGTSGRQEDISNGAGMAMYDSPLEANASLWSEALDMAFHICSNDVLDLLPPDLKKEDVDSYIELRVDIKKEDPQDMSRKAAEGDRRFEMGIIDSEELYINYMGKTKKEAQELKAKVWIETAMRTDPAFRQLIIQTAAEEMGKEEQLAQIQAQMAGSKGLNPVPKIGSEGGQPRTGNIKTPQGINMADIASRKEPRLPPR